MPTKAFQYYSSYDKTRFMLVVEKPNEIQADNEEHATAPELLECKVYPTLLRILCIVG